MSTAYAAMLSKASPAGVRPQSACGGDLLRSPKRLKLEAEQATKIAGIMWSGNAQKIASAYNEVSNARPEIVRISVDSVNLTQQQQTQQQQTQQQQTQQQQTQQQQRQDAISYSSYAGGKDLIHDVRSALTDCKGLKVHAHHQTHSALTKTKTNQSRCWAMILTANSEPGSTYLSSKVSNGMTSLSLHCFRRRMPKRRSLNKLQLRCLSI